MKQGFVTAVMDQYSIEEVIDFAASNGFECIEAACWPKEKAERRYAGVTHIDVDKLDHESAEYILTYCRNRNICISLLPKCIGS